VSGRNVVLHLDHASVAVPDLVDAVARLDRRLGLSATVSPAAPDRHSRVHLHRSYLEVSVEPGRTGWEATMCFLRFDDPDVLRTHLDDAGIEYRFGEWIGVDGTWDDVDVGLAGTPLPTLIRRTGPAAIARDWPPPLAEPHRCGARNLSSVHLDVPSVDAAIQAYRKLVSRNAVSVGANAVRVRLASGELVLREAPTARVAGIVLGVPSLAATRAALELPLPRDEEGIAWLGERDLDGLRLGFVEHAGRPGFVTLSASADPQVSVHIRWSGAD
jgi:hypothetical protein